MRRLRETDAPSKRKLRIYSDGVFDLFHLGHMKMLEQVRRKFPAATLVVGVCSDRDTHTHKGLTVMTMEERVESLSHCKWVDEVIRDAPWIITKEFLDKNSIDYVAHDSLPYSTNGMKDVYKEVKEMGVFVETNRTEGISTSEIINRILRRYRAFLYRNIKRGATCKELNINRITLYSIFITEEIKIRVDLLKKAVEKIQIRNTLKTITETAREITDHARARINLFLR